MNQDYDERLSTIYESPSPQPRIEDDEEDIYDDAYDKLIVYDIAPIKPIEKVKKNRINIIYKYFIFLVIKN